MTLEDYTRLVEDKEHDVRSQMDDRVSPKVRNEIFRQVADPISSVCDAIRRIEA